MIKLHSAVLLFALAGLFAKWLPLGAYWLVLGRTGFAALTLISFLAITQRHALRLNSKDGWLFLASGLLLLIHWLSFFYAIQWSTVAFGLLVFASFPVFTLFISALVTKKLPQKADYLQALAMIVGIALLVWDVGFNANAMALLVGLASAFTFSLLLLVNQSLAMNYRSATIASYQNLIAFALALPMLILPSEAMNEVVNHLPALVVLGVIFTALAHSLLTSSLRHLSAFVVSLAICLEPVYGTIAAALLLNEPVSIGVIAGGLVILSVNVYHALTSNR